MGNSSSTAATLSQPLIEWERAPATQVRVKYEHYQEYLKLIPALNAKPVPIAIDEWAYMDRESPLGSFKTAPSVRSARMHSKEIKKTSNKGRVYAVGRDSVGL